MIKLANYNNQACKCNAYVKTNTKTRLLLFFINFVADVCVGIDLRPLSARSYIYECVCFFPTEKNLYNEVVYILSIHNSGI